jgi:methylmalonyl-CoA mutase, C-terminal domain
VRDVSARRSTGGPAEESVTPRPIRVLIAKPGLDGHDRGAKVVARALRDAGMEVVYTGLRQTSAMIVRAAVQEDVEAVGLSVLSGAHLQHFEEVTAGLRRAGADDVLVFGGGIVPSDDVPALLSLGVERVFTPGASTIDIVAYVREAVTARRRARGSDAARCASLGGAS